MPSHVTAWAVVVYERQQRFNQQNVADLLKGMRQSAKAVGASPSSGSLLSLIDCFA